MEKFSLSLGCRLFLVYGARMGHVDWVFNRSPVHDVLNGV